VVYSERQRGHGRQGEAQAEGTEGRRSARGTPSQTPPRRPALYDARQPSRRSRPQSVTPATAERVVSHKTRFKRGSEEARRGAASSTQRSWCLSLYAARGRRGTHSQAQSLIAECLRKGAAPAKRMPSRRHARQRTAPVQRARDATVRTKARADRDEQPVYVPSRYECTATFLSNKQILEMVR